MRSSIAGLAVIAACVLAGWAVAAAPQRVGGEGNVMGERVNNALRGIRDAMGYGSAAAKGTIPKVYNVTMRDGVNLTTTVWLPWEVPAAGKVATVLDRSPYGSEGTELLSDLFLPGGFAAVGQNERATGTSGGTWTYWATAATDNQDTVAWIKAQPWSNGVVCQMGFSADGLLTNIADMLPQDIDAQWTGWTASQPYRVAFQNGAQRYQLTHHWLSHMHAFRPNAPPYINVMEDHEPMSEWWTERTMDTPAQLATIKHPGVWWAASYDIFTQTELDAFFLFQHQTGDGARGNQRMIFNTRGHCISDKGAHFEFPDDRLGDVWSYQQALSLFQAVDKGYDVATYDAFAHLPGTTAGDLKTYTIYVIGPQRVKDTESFASDSDVGMYWTTLDAWPTPTNKTLYLAPSGKLVDAAPASATPAVASFVYNPHDPVPTIGGNNLFYACGPLDQTPLNSRPDIVSWTSEPFTEPTAFAGRMLIELYVSGNVTDTDFTVRTTDVYPGSDAPEILLSDNVQRMLWRDSDTTPSLMVPGEVYAIKIEMWWQAYVFAPGHSLGLHISSSSFPRWTVNPNNGLFVNQTGPVYYAANAVHYNAAAAPSSITIPFVSLKDLPRNVVV